MSNAINAATGTGLAAELVLGQMREVLRSPELTATDHFFDFGGDSVLAAGLAGRLRRITGLELPYSCLFSYPTAQKLGAVLAEKIQAR